MTFVADDRRTWDEPAFVAVVLATLSAALATAWIAAAAMGVHEQRYDTAQLAAGLLARETAALMTLDLLAKRYLGITFVNLRLPRASWGQVALGAALGGISVVLFGVLLARFDTRAEDEILRAAVSGTAPWRLALFVIVGAYSPVVQEIVFRGLLLRGLLQRMHSWVAIGVSSAAFALVHAGGGAGSVIDAFLFGILTGALFVRFRSLAAPIAAHIAGNSLATLYLLWPLHHAGR
jgi:membrane protease YdiL (CAAX protease family)